MRRSRINPGRAAACERLTRAAANYPDIPIEGLRCDAMDPRDEALAHAIDDAAIRRWLTIEQLGRGFLRQGWSTLSPEVAAALLAGSAQMLFLDRIPIHAAIDEAVEWIKGTRASKASGMVNAVLRKIARLIAVKETGEKVKRPAWTNQADELPLPDGSSLVLTKPIFAGDPLDRAGMVCSIPRWQMCTWHDQFDRDTAIRLAWHSLTPAPTVVQVGYATKPVESDLLVPGVHAGSCVFTGSRSELLELLRDRCDIWVQDATSARAIGYFQSLLHGSQAATGNPITRIIDLCAGRGTKTRQLLAGFPDARVLACEVNGPRLDDLATLARRAEGRLQVCHAREASRHIGSTKADLVLVDVPCSNSGVLARRTEARHRLAGPQLDRLINEQQAICTTARTLLKPGGYLLYATCSLDENENNAMATWICQKLGFTLVEAKQSLPQGGPGRPAGDYADGGYAALLQKP